MSSEIAIKVENLSKCYHIYDQPRDRLKQMILPRLQRAAGAASKQYFREFWALKDVSFEVKKGETVGIIGRNGSGKSTLLQMICGTLNPTSGSLQTHGRIAALLELGAGFNPEFTGRENVYLNAAVLGLGYEEIEARFDQIAAFADIGDFIEQPVKTYSSGMMVRLAFAVAIHADPEILIVDEALSVGDAYFQAKCAHRIRSIINKGVTVLFVSHDTASVKSLCSRAILLDSGRSIFFGEVNAAVEKYYSALVASQRNEQSAESPKSAVSIPPGEHMEGAENFRAQAAFQRIQNGVAEFVNVKLLDDSGRTVDSVGFGEQVTLRQVVRVYKPILQLGLGYHIRDKNGLDIIYSDTGIEKKHLQPSGVGGVYAIDWTFTVFLREGNYVIASMLSEPIDLEIGSVTVVDFVPISTSFSVARKGNLPIYATSYWKNRLNILKLNNEPGE